MVEMIKLEDGNYVPKECCTVTNPLTSGGKSYVDDVELPCGENCDNNCGSCVIQKIMNEYAELVEGVKCGMYKWMYNAIIYRKIDGKVLQSKKFETEEGAECFIEQNIETFVNHDYPVTGHVSKEYIKVS